MKMKIALTADELQNVIDAVMDEAIDRDYYCDYDEIADDMLHIVDAALSAMGIEIIEDDFDEEDDWYDEEEEEEEDDDEEDLNPIEELVFVKNGKRTITKAVADMLLSMVAEVIIADDRVPADRKWEVTQGVFLAFAEDHGIECVDDGE